MTVRPQIAVVFSYSANLFFAIMSKRAFDKIKAGLDDAKAFLEGTADTKRYRVHVPAQIDVKKIRRRRGLSQEFELTIFL